MKSFKLVISTILLILSACSLALFIMPPVTLDGRPMNYNDIQIAFLAFTVCAPIALVALIYKQD